MFCDFPLLSSPLLSFAKLQGFEDCDRARQEETTMDLESVRGKKQWVWEDLYGINMVMTKEELDTSGEGDVKIGIRLLDVDNAIKMILLKPLLL